MKTPKVGPHKWGMRQGSKPKAETPQAARFTRAQRAGLPARAPIFLGFAGVEIDSFAPIVVDPQISCDS